MTDKMESPQYDKSLLKTVGENVYISERVEIKRPQLISIGSEVAIDSGFYITTGAELADHIHIGPYVIVVGGAKGLLSMGNFSNISAGGRIICGSDSFNGEGLVSVPGIPDEYRNDLIIKPIIFADFVNVGTNVVIMPGVKLGEGSVVGACSLVREDTEPWTVYAGCPAKPIKIRRKDKIIEYAKKLGY